MFGYLLLAAIAAMVAYAFLQHVAIRTAIADAYDRLAALIRKGIGDFEMPISKSFHLYSQRLNAFATLVVLPYIITSNGGFIGQAVELLPAKYRLVAGMLAGPAAFYLVTWARLRIQPPKPNA